MNSNISSNGRLIDIADRAWREEKLPDELITVPTFELPVPESDSGNPQETLREQEQKWTDLALNKISSNSEQKATYIKFMKDL